MLSVRAKREQKETRFYAWVGRCIKRWAEVESRLFDICQLVLAIGPLAPRSDDDKARERVAAVIFFRLPSIDMRINLISELLRARLPPKEKKSGAHDPPILKRWNGLMVRTKKLLPARNFLAHQPATRYVAKEWTPVTSVEDLEWDHTVYQHPGDWMRQPSQIEWMGVKEMISHQGEVIKLSTDLWLFEKELRAALSALPK